MELPVVNMSGKQVSTVELPADIFGVEVNVGLMHQAYVRQMANARQGTHKTKTRGEINASKIKIYRQKGTGRARHGAKSAPIFVGGGVAHGPRPRKYTKQMPRKMRQGAIRSALSALVRDEQIILVDRMDLESGKTRDMRKILLDVAGTESALVLVTQGNDMVRRGANNLARAQALRVEYLNMRDLLTHEKVIVPLDALEVIEKLWGREAKKHA
jgi:large subunit ribosomal protein L4